MCPRVVSAIAITCAWTDICVVAETLEDWDTPGALCVSGDKRDAKAVMQGCTDKVGIQVAEGGCGLPMSQPPAPAGIYNDGGVSLFCLSV